MAQDQDNPISANVVRATLAAVALIVVLWPAAVTTKPFVSLDTNPRGASVFINGRLAGSTPLQIVGLPSGEYSLRLEKSGFVSIQRHFMLGTTSLPVNETLTEVQSESITVGILPEGSEVVLDGEIRGHTPLVLANVPVGSHELEVRKPNFNTYAKRVELEHGNPQIFKLTLDDKILDMLKRNIAKEPQSVRHYMDMGQYLYKTREVLESAKYFAKALEISATPLEAGPDMPASELAAESAQRSQEREKLNFVINDKEQQPSKDRAEFTRIIEATREFLTTNAANFKDWGWTQNQAMHYANQGKLDQAHQLLLKHIEVVKDKSKLEQPYIFLLDIELQMKRLELAHETYATFSEAYPLRPDLMRQAGHALYSKQGQFEDHDRGDVLSMAEKLFRSAIAVSKKINDSEMAGQCSFELGNVLVFQDHQELAAGAYRDSITLTKSPSAKEDRMQPLVECLRKTKQFAEARKYLYELGKSSRAEVATKAKQDLKALALQEPSPDNK